MDYRSLFSRGTTPAAASAMLERKLWQQKLYRARDAYAGHFPDALRTKPGAPNDNVKVNLCQVAVDKSVDFLFGREVQFTLDGLDATSAEERYLRDVWAANNKTALLQRLATNGGIYGQAFLKIRPELPMPRLLVLDPCMVEVVTSPDDFQRVQQYILHWEGVDPFTGKKQAYRQLIERIEASVVIDEVTGSLSNIAARWRITDQVADVEEIKFDVPKVWVTLQSEMWLYDFPPIVEFQNQPSPNSYWGVSDLEPAVIALNESINKSLSNINKILRLHAHPKTYTMGLSPEQQAQVVIDADGMLHIPGSPQETSLANLEMKSDLQSSIDYYLRLREAFYELTSTPEITSGKVQDLSYLSATAMQILYWPLIEKTNTKRITYGAGLVEVNRRLLALAGRGDQRRPVVVWPEVLPRDKQAEAQTAVMLKQVGVSIDTILEGMGLDPEVERTRRATDLDEEVKRIKATGQQTSPVATPPFGVASYNS